jgi:sphinganine-1-phosphate aldolase
MPEPQNKLFSSLPEDGWDPQTILSRLTEKRQGDVDWRSGRVWSLVYHVDDVHHQLLQDAYGQFLSENYLNPLAFQSLKGMEEEIVRTASELLQGDPKTVGVMSSGGTESIFLALYTYREWARKHRRRVKKPEIVVPETIHAAFQKAAHYLGLTVKTVPVGEDQRVDPEAMFALVNRRTILLAASSPQYPHGVQDPIAEIAQFAQQKKIPLHVDACLGGFMLPWVEELGYPVAPFDFRVPGVTSISADLHKFGFAAKGASVILYRSMDYLKHQFYISTEWSGGIYAAATFQGSRSGGALAAAWASLYHFGRKGYLKLAREMMNGAQKFRQGIKGISGLEIVGDPVMNVMAFRSTDPKVDIFAIADQLIEKGWFPDRLQKPDALHVMIMPHHLPRIEAYLADIREATDFVKANPKLAAKGEAALYGMIGHLPFRGAVRSGVEKMFTEMYTPGEKAGPERKGFTQRLAEWYARWRRRR